MTACARAASSSASSSTPTRDRSKPPSSAGAQQIELCTAAYADATLGARAVRDEGRAHAAEELERLRAAAALAARSGLHVAAGHGLTYRNVAAVASIPEIVEFNIGHNVVAHAIFAGLAEAVREMRARIREGPADAVKGEGGKQGAKGEGK